MVTAHVLVKNEENFIWYSIISAIDYIDEIMIWDTGSKDATKEIVNELVGKYPRKIKYRDVGEADENKYSLIRQEMLDATKSDWVFVLDGDEIYFESSIRQITEEINRNGSKIETIVVPTINLVGDIFHYQEEKAGQYQFGKRKGHYNLRFINRNIPGLHISSPYGKEGFFDDEDKPIQDRDEGKMKFIDAPYIHTTHLARSSKDSEVMQRNKKRKHEIGIEFPKDFYYPESFFMVRSEIIPNIWKKMDFKFKLRAYLEMPLRKAKRRLI